MPYSPTLSDNLDINEVRSHLGGAGEYLAGLQRLTPEQRGDTYADDVRSAVDFIHTYDALLTAAERSIEPPAPLPPEARGPLAAFAAGLEARVSPGREFVEADGYADWNSRGRPGNFSAESRTLLISENTDPGAGVWRPVGTPVLRAGTARQQRLFVRDLISVQSTSLSSVPYIQEVNAATNETGAATTAEGSAKAEVTMQFRQADAPIRKITAWIPVTDEILADAPTLRGYIDNRLAYMILLREEAQVLAGNGTSPNISGILDQTDIQTQSAVNNDVPATIGLAIAKIENVDGEADGVAMNPLDFWAAVTTRHSTQFDNGFGGNAPAAMSSITWGLPVVRTRSLTSLTAIVGSWFLGATLFQREGVTIAVGNQHDDYFVKNKVAIRGEERVGLAVHRPDFFVNTTLDITA